MEMFPEGEEKYDHRIRRGFQFNKTEKPCLEIILSSSNTNIQIIEEVQNKVSYAINFLEVASMFQLADSCF